MKITNEKVSDSTKFAGYKNAQYDQYIAKDDNNVDQYQNNNGNYYGSIVEFLFE